MKLRCLRPPLATTGAPNASGWKPDSVRGNRHRRGYGWAWEKLRRAVLKRDEGLCQPCLKTLGRPTPATEVDHIVPRAHGGSDDEANLQSICEACHLAKTAHEGGA